VVDYRSGMDRAKVGTSVGPKIAVSVDEVLVDPDGQNVTYGVTRANGTVAVAAGTVATRQAVGVYQATLSGSAMALLDTLTITWTYLRSGATQVETTVVEVVGGFLFPLSDLRKRLTDTNAYPTSDLVAARTMAEQELEQRAGTAFVPRYAYERVFMTYPQYSLDLGRMYVRSIREVTIEGIAFSAGDVAGLAVDTTGLIRRRTGILSWWWGAGIANGGANIFIGYEHGMDRPPEPVRQAAVDLAQYHAQTFAATSGVDPRATRIITQDGTVELAQVGEGGTGIPSVDRVVVGSYGLPGVA
jgi:hypothetical protein